MGRNPMSGEDEPLVSRRALAAFVLCAVGACALVITLSVREQRRCDAAEEQVQSWCRRLDADKLETKRWRRWDGELLPDRDPWGHQLRVRYENRQFGEKFTVSSDGPDGAQWTADDIEWTVNNVEWLAMVRESAGAVEAVAGAASRGIVGGAIEGVTDHLPKDVRDSLGIPGSRDAPAEKTPDKPARQSPAK